jgi:hypothetical protein
MNDPMKAKQIVEDLRALGPQDTNVLFQCLSDRVYTARLANGQRLLDASDFIAWLRLLAAEWNEAQLAEERPEIRNAS